MKKFLVLLGVGFVGALLARHALRPTPPVPTSNNPTVLVRTFDAPAGALSEIENLLTLARQPSRTAAQVRELQRAVDRWLLADPEACIAWLENRKATGLIRKELLPSVCAFRLDGRMVNAMRLAAQISDPLLHYAFISAAFEAAAEIHPGEAFDALVTMPVEKRSKLGQELVGRWARKEPRKAWEAVSAASNVTEVIQWVGPCMVAWEMKDSHGLQQYIREQLAKPDRKSPLEWGLWMLGTDRPATILQLLSGRERSSRLQSIWEGALSRAIDRNGDPTSALRFARMEPAGPRREFALLAVGMGLARSEKPQRLEEVMQELNPDTRRDLERFQGYAVARFSPTEISEFADRMPDGFSRSTAMSNYVQGVLKYQTQALVEMALNTSTPEVGPDWLDMIASNLRTNPVTSKAGEEDWIAKLDPPKRERLGPELQRRLSPGDWSRVQSRFQNVRR